MIISYLVPLGIFFLLLTHVLTSLVIVYFIAQIKPMALQLEYLEGTTDIMLDAQKEQTKLIIALVENV